MAQIYDNISTQFTEGLKSIISNTQVKRVDFCVGYFNLRGWGLILNEVDALDGDFVYENDEGEFVSAKYDNSGDTYENCEEHKPAKWKFN